QSAIKPAPDRRPLRACAISAAFMLRFSCARSTRSLRNGSQFAAVTARHLGRSTAGIEPLMKCVPGDQNVSPEANMGNLAIRDALTDGALAAASHLCSFVDFIGGALRATVVSFH